jgi:hypothetical protein
MATRRHLCLLSLLPAVAALACGSKSDDGRGAYIASYCDAYRPCCSAAGLSVNAAQCRMVVGSVPPSATFDKSAADACVNGINQLTNQGQSCGADFQEPASCSQVFVVPPGTKPVGSTCTGDLDCAPVAGAMVHCITWFANGSNQSECQVETRGQQGSTPCFGTVENGVPTLGGDGTNFPSEVSLCYIDDGLYCDGTTCVALKQLGDACAASSECVRSAFCDLSVGQCASLKATGNACNSSLECQPGTYCASTTAVCTPQLDIGAACDDPEACASGSCVAGACAALPNGNLSYICAGPP